MDTLLGQALDRVFGDLAATGVPVPRVEESAWQPWQPSESARLLAASGASGASGARGVWVDLTLTEVEQLAMVADQVQEFVVEDLPSHQLPTNWPRCPEHPDNHPMAAVVQDGRAVWACPASGRPAAEVGGLTA